MCLLSQEDFFIQIYISILVSQCLLYAPESPCIPLYNNIIFLIPKELPVEFLFILFSEALQVWSFPNFIF